MLQVRPKSFIQASKGVAYSAASLLGQNKSVKCIVDEDNGFQLTSSVFRLLQAVVVEHPAISMIHDVCQGLHKYCGTGCATMVFMLGSWLQSFETLLDMNIPSPIIHHLVDEALASCLEELEESAMTLGKFERLDKKEAAVPKQTVPSTKNEFEINAASLKEKVQPGENFSTETGKLYPLLNSSKVLCNERQAKNLQKRSSPRPVPNRYSRHLMDDVNAEIESDRITLMHVIIQKLSTGLSRGSEFVSNLLGEMLALLLPQKTHSSFRDFRIEEQRVFTQIIEDRQCSESHVFEGICISTTTSDIRDSKKLFDGKFVKICLLDFELLAHSAELLNRRGLCDTSGAEKASNHSLQSNFTKLLSLGVLIIFFKGDKTSFIEECQCFGIIAINVLSFKHLEAMSDATGSTIVSSIEDVDQTDIGRPVKLSLIQYFERSKSCGTDQRKKTSLIAVNLEPNDLKFVTVVLCGTTLNMAQLLEESFWSAFYKLRNVLHCGKFIKGCGLTELRCAKKLRAIAESNTTNRTKLHPGIPRWMSSEIDLYRRTVYCELAEGLERYSSQLKLNAQNTPDAVVLDDLVSKTEAWKRAMKLVKSISNIDMVITTGIEEGRGSVL